MKYLVKPAKSLPAFGFAFLRHDEIQILFGIHQAALLMSVITFAMVYPFYWAAGRLVRYAWRTIKPFRRRIILLYKVKRYARTGRL